MNGRVLAYRSKEGVELLLTLDDSERGIEWLVPENQCPFLVDFGRTLELFIKDGVEELTGG